MSGETNFRVIQREYPDLQPPTAVLVGYRGSIAHGMYVPKSNPDSVDDKDVMAIVVPPIDCYFGLKDYGTRGTKEIKRDEWDIVVYEMRKFVGLLANGNPNVIGMLWMDSTGYLECTDAGRMLIQHRDLFATRAAYHSFVGYAHGQLHRMTHYKFEGYMGEKRKELVDRFGYDTKNAAHLIRLLRMGIEFMLEGRLHVLREDAVQLLEVKRGEWSLEKVKNEADRLFKRAEAAYDSSQLPASPNMDAINALCTNVIQAVHRGAHA